MRIFCGTMLGTVLNLGLFAGFTYLNGTPVPSVKTPVALVAYPTGSVTDTLVIAGVVYFFCLTACALRRRS